MTAGSNETIRNWSLLPGLVHADCNLQQIIRTDSYPPVVRQITPWSPRQGNNGVGRRTSIVAMVNQAVAYLLWAKGRMSHDGAK